MSLTPVSWKKADTCQLTLISLHQFKEIFWYTVLILLGANQLVTVKCKGVLSHVLNLILSENIPACSSVQDQVLETVQNRCLDIYYFHKVGFYYHYFLRVVSSGVVTFGTLLLYSLFCYTQLHTFFFLVLWALGYPKTIIQ